MAFKYTEINQREVKTKKERTLFVMIKKKKNRRHAANMPHLIQQPETKRHYCTTESFKQTVVKNSNEKAAICYKYKLLAHHQRRQSSS